MALIPALTNAAQLAHEYSLGHHKRLRLEITHEGILVTGSIRTRKHDLVRHSELVSWQGIAQAETSVQGMVRAVNRIVQARAAGL